MPPAGMATPSRRSSSSHQERLVAPLRALARRPRGGSRRRAGGLPQGLPPCRASRAARAVLHLALPHRRQPLPEPVAAAEGRPVLLVAGAGSRPGERQRRAMKACITIRADGGPGAEPSCWRASGGARRGSASSGCRRISGSSSCWPGSRGSRGARSPRRSVSRRGRSKAGWCGRCGGSPRRKKRDGGFQ